MIGNKAYCANRQLVNSSLMSRNSKLQIYRTLVRPVVTCGSESWTLTMEEERPLAVFERKILRKIYGPVKENKLWRIRRNDELEAIIKKTRIKLYNTLALPVLLYGSETWTIKARDARRITAAQMKYMRRTAGYIWTDYKTNAQIAKELKITPILDKLLEYKRNWIQHVNRMPRNRLPRAMKPYSPTGRRNHDRPLKRLLDT